MEKIEYLAELPVPSPGDLTYLQKVAVEVQIGTRALVEEAAKLHAVLDPAKIKVEATDRYSSGEHLFGLYFSAYVEEDSAL